MSMRPRVLRIADSMVARCAPIAVRGVLLMALAGYLAGCSLLSIKSPEKPLSPRDFNARILSHEFATHFNTAIEHSADGITAGTQDPAVKINALRWKIGATGASLRAASQVIPMVSFLDSWSLADQMRDFLTVGPGRSLFGADQPAAVSVATDLAHQVQELARDFMEPSEFASSQGFVDDYARAHPIDDLDFARASILEIWAQNKGGKAKLIDSLGTFPEALGQTSDLLRMYGTTVTSQALWRTQLAAQESGISGADVQAMIKRLDERFERMSAIAESTPELVHGVVRDVSKRADAGWLEMLGTVRSERLALSATVAEERQAAVEAVDQERAAAAADAARISSQILRDAGEQIRRLVREALMLVIVLVALLLGLPFAAGYFVGRVHRRS